MMLSNIKLIATLFIVGLCGFSISSCNFVITQAIGVKSIKPRESKKIKKYSEKFNIPNELSYIIDTTSFCNDVELLDTLYKTILNDLMQPLQVRAYRDREKELSFFMANCYTTGFPNLKWNDKGVFSGNLLNDTLKRKGKDYLMSEVREFQTKNANYSFTLDKDFFHLIPLYEKINADLYEDDSQYIVIVYWTVFMNRQSKRLIKLVQNFQKNSNKEVKLYYVNLDNLYLTKCINVRE